MSDVSEDFILPFMIEAGAIRGRLVRLGPALDTILRGHDYPPAVATRLAETLALAAALAGGLKYDGQFILQIQSQGAIPLIVADIASTGDLRGYARYDADKLAAAEQDASEQTPVARYFGEGFLAFTVDQGPDTDRYQGIVALDGDSLANCVEGYFQQSEQLETAVILAVRPPLDGGLWQAAAVTIQRMPVVGGSPILTGDQANENWRRAEILLRSLQERELFDPTLSAEQLLYRLYHADSLSGTASRPLQAQCRCSQERIEATLRSFSRHDVAEMRDERGEISVVCEFCKTAYIFADEDLNRLYSA